MSMLSEPARRGSPWAMLALAVLPVVAASALGGWITYPAIPAWYAGLTKPGFNPPNWIFGPVWTTLDALMAFAVWRILRLPANTPGRSAALTAYWVQLALNIAWSFLFFGAHSPLLGLVDIVPQLIAILVTIMLFRKLDTIASWCLVPLAAWVSFATLLNVVIWRLNG